LANGRSAPGDAGTSGRSTTKTCKARLPARRASSAAFRLAELEISLAERETAFSPALSFWAIRDSDQVRYTRLAAAFSSLSELSASSMCWGPGHRAQLPRPGPG
jgi:hypothetical protein